MLLSRAGKFLPVLALLITPLFSLYSQEDYGYDDDLLFEDDAGITVTGTIQTTQQISIIDKDDIERRNAKDIANLLQETLDLNINMYGGYGNQSSLSLRGFDSKRVAFLIDGVPVNSSTDGKFDIYQIDMNSIERIEVIYGGSDSRFNVSGALGGVVNIITVKKQQEGWRLGASVSNTSAMPGEYWDYDGNKRESHWEDLADAQNYTISSAYGSDVFSFSANVFANRAENHFIYMDYFDYNRRKVGNEVWDAGLNVSMVREFSNLTKLIASTNFYYGDRNIPISGFARYFGNQKDFSGRQNLMLETPRAFHDDLSTEVSLTWNFNRLDYEPPTGAASLHDQHNLTAINRWGWHLADKLTLRSGFDYRFNFLDSSEMGSRSRHDGGIYLTAEFKPENSLLIVPSVKVVATNINLMEAIPKLGLMWEITESLTFRNNYFRSFKFPDFEELYWSGGGGTGNPDLLPEDGWGGDIGAEWRYKNLIKLESVFFTQWIKNSIHWYSMNNNIWRPENVGEAIFFGLDNKIGFEIPVSRGPFKKISPSVSYKYLRSYLLSFGYNFDSDKRIPYNPEHTIGGSVDIFWNKGSLIISAHYEGLRYVDRANLKEMEPYFLLNAAVNQEITKNLSIFASLRNILNQSYESFSGYPMPGITITAGMRFNMELK
jgi:vitamin B12 transporter